MTSHRAYPTWLASRALASAEAPLSGAGADGAALRCRFELAFVPHDLPDPAALLLTFALDCVDWDELAAKEAARFARRPLAAYVAAETEATR